MNPQNRSHLRVGRTIWPAIFLLVAGCSSAADQVDAATTTTPPPLSTARPVTEPSVSEPSIPVASATSSTAASTTTVTSTVTVPPAGASPQEVAVAWLVAYRSASWQDEALAWIDRASAVATPDLAASYDALRDGKGGGIAWNEFTANRCTATVTDTGAVIPPEAPSTASQVAVQVGGTLLTVCETGKQIDPEALAATLTLTRELGSEWKVASRDF